MLGSDVGRDGTDRVLEADEPPLLLLKVDVGVEEGDGEGSVLTEGDRLEVSAWSAGGAVAVKAAVEVE